MANDDKHDNSGGLTVSGVNLGELSKPATVLVEKISEAVGGIFRPYQILRVAKAEAEADRIRAEGHIAITDLHRRAFHRFLEEEAKRQQNIEDITKKALPDVKSDSKPSEIDDDWITDFFDKGRIISDGEMQALWARVLAGEANQPGSYSKRTVALLASLSKSEAEVFTAYSSLLWRTNGGRYIIDHEIVSKFWPSRTLSFTAAQQHLHNIGLVGEIGAFSRPWSSLPDREFIYFDEQYRLKFGAGYQKPMIEPLFFSFTYLTGSGQELLRVAQGGKLVGYADAVMKACTAQYPQYKLEYERIPLNGGL